MSISSLSPPSVFNMEIHGLGMPPNPRASSPDLTKEAAREVPAADAKDADDDVQIETSPEESAPDALDVAAREVSSEVEREVPNNEEEPAPQNREEVRAQPQRREFTRYSEKMKSYEDYGISDSCCECYKVFIQGHSGQRNAEEWEKQRDLWYEGKKKECCIQGLSNRKRWCETHSVNILMQSGCVLSLCAATVGCCATGIICTGCGLISCVCCSTLRINKLPCCIIPCGLGAATYGCAGIFCANAAFVIGVCVSHIFRLPANLCCSECMSLGGQHAFDYGMERMGDLFVRGSQWISEQTKMLTGAD